MPKIWMPEFSIEEKEQLKLERLQTTLNRAYKNVPFHRNRFLERQLSPEDITSLKDIEKLPFMNRAHLGIHYPYGLFAVPLRDIVRIHTAPGTGDSPSISGYTKADLVIWKKLVARSLEAAGVTEMDIVQIHLPPGLAKRKQLPPGLAKRDIPDDLASQLPWRVDEEIKIIDDEVVLIERATGVVLDILLDGVRGGQ